jgi:sec-independent protein translocase protein TatB
LGPRHLTDLTLAEAGLDDAIMVQNGDAIAREPHVTFEAVRTELERQFEGSKGVFWSMCPGPTMGEGSRGIEQGRKSLLHGASVARGYDPRASSGGSLAAVFNVTGSEILILLVLALVVVGPERLPEVARKFAKSYGELKKMSTGFQTELRDALDEPLREMRSTADQLRKTIEDPINETIAVGTDAAKGNLADSPAKSTETTPSKNPAVDPVLFADGAQSIDDTSAAEPVRPSSPFDTAVSSASPRKSIAAIDASSTEAVADVLPPPAGLAMLPPPGASATAFLPPPTAAQAADPLIAPETPSE